MTIAAQLTDAPTALNFMFAGKSTFTLKSRKTGCHLSFKLTRSKDGKVYFVKARKGGDNGEGGFNYVGYFRPAYHGNGGIFHTSAKSHSVGGALKALEWSVAKMLSGDMPGQLEVWTEGRCGCCNRKLTDPVSIQRGIGPECYKKATGSKVVSMEAA